MGLVEDYRYAYAMRVLQETGDPDHPVVLNYQRRHAVPEVVPPLLVALYGEPGPADDGPVAGPAAQ